MTVLIVYDKKWKELIKGTEIIKGSKCVTDQSLLVSKVDLLKRMNRENNK